MANVYKAKIDIKNVKPNFKPVFIQYDHARLEIELVDNGRKYDFSNVNLVEFTHIREDGAVIIQSGEIVTDSNRQIIRYEYQGSEMDVVGTVETSFAVFDANNKKVSTHTFEVTIIKDPRDEIFNPAEPSFGLLQTLINDVEYIKENGGSGGVGPKGDKGEDGYTPIKGVDYFDGKDGDKGDPFTYADFTPSQLEALRGPKGDKGENGSDADITAHASDVAPHQYGGRFEWRYNTTTNSLDLVVLD